MASYPTRSVPSRTGATILIPTPEATEGMSVLMYNFSGPGWNSSEGGMAARPVETFDFASKLHDLHYCISDIGFKTVGEHEAEAARGGLDARALRDRSHQHKADRIFRIMVEHNGNWGLGPYYSRTRFIHEHTEWALPDDGFINILTEPMLVQVLCEYRMMPWSELPRGSRAYREPRPMGPRGGQQPPRPNYSAPVPEDQRWFEWTKDFYAPVWAQVLAVI
jgi:hypothetical protein